MAALEYDPDPVKLAEAEKVFAERRPLLVAIAERLEAHVKHLLEGVPHVDRVSFRAKKADSYAKKSRALKKDKTTLKYSQPLVQLEDQVGGRVLVFFRRDMEAVTAMLKEEFNALEHVHKTEADHKAFAYESNHLICTYPPTLYPDGWMDLDPRPKSFELQIRTLAMHAWAEPEHDLTYKPGVKVGAEDLRKLAWAASSAWGIDAIFEQVNDSIAKANAAASGS